MTWFGFVISFLFGAAVGVWIMTCVCCSDEEDGIQLIPYRHEKDNTPPRVDFLKLMMQEDIRQEEAQRK